MLGGWLDLMILEVFSNLRFYYSVLTETHLNLRLSHVPSVSLPATWEVAEPMWSCKHGFDLALPGPSTDSGMVSYRYWRKPFIPCALYYCVPYSVTKVTDLFYFFWTSVHEPAFHICMFLSRSSLLGSAGEASLIRLWMAICHILLSDVKPIDFYSFPFGSPFYLVFPLQATFLSTDLYFTLASFICFSV